MNGDGRIAEHGFRARGGDGEELAGIFAIGAENRIFDLPQWPLCSEWMTSRSLMAVWQPGHQLTMYAPR